jgi:hypothetical protein
MKHDPIYDEPAVKKFFEDAGLNPVPTWSVTYSSDAERPKPPTFQAVPLVNQILNKIKR